MKKISLLLSVSIALSACSYFGDEEQKRLEGDRLSLYDFEKTLQKDPNTQFGMHNDANNIITLPQSIKNGIDETLVLPKPWSNQFWPQVGGYPNHAMKHMAFNNNQPKKLWSKSIGAGGTTRMPLTTTPIMADNKIFTVNNDAVAMAFDAHTGRKIWDTSIIKPKEDEVVIGGGLGFSGGKLYATNGFNEIIAIDPNNGDILWRNTTKSPIRAAPSAIPGRVFVTTLDNETIAFDGTDGKKLWSHRGLGNSAGILGASTPALTKDTVIAAYGSGEIYALQINTGTELWSENLSPISRNAGQSSLTDIRALPVIVDNVVYAASFNNRMSAIDLRTGRSKWQIAMGANSTPWVAGNRLFVIETAGTLISINKDTGNIIWQTSLPTFEDADDQEGKISWQGPILAGNRLIVTGSNGKARDYNPVDGSLIRQWDIGEDNIYLAPLMAKETLFMLSDNGRLNAWK